MKRALVTGANGFIGRNLVPLLSEYYSEVVIVVRRESEYFLDLSNVKTVYTKDLYEESETWWLKVVEGIDDVYHLAWYIESDYLTSLENYKNLYGSLKFFDCIKDSGVKKVIALGSCFEYEITGNYLTVDSPVDCGSIYSESKNILCQRSQLLFGDKVSFIWCRVFFVYGDGEPKRKLYTSVVKSITNREEIKLSNPFSVRDFISVKNASEQILNLGLFSESGIFNICTGIPKSVYEFCVDIAENTRSGSKELIVYDDNGLYSKKDFIVGIK